MSRSMGRRLLTAVLTALVLLTAAPSDASAAFIRTAQGTKWLAASGNYAKGYVRIGSNYYFFDSNGIMKTGVQRVGTKLYFFSTKTGARLTGWIYTSSGTYYANKSTGALLTSTTWGKYTFGADGKLVKNAGSETAANAKSGWVTSGGKTYYYVNGKKATGLVTVGTHRYYFGTDGVLKRKSVVTVNSERYYVGEEGYVLSSQFVSWNGKTYFASSEGKLAKGITKVGKYWYFFYTKNCAMAKKVLVSSYGNSYYLQANGRALTGSQLKVNGSWYYFDTDAKMVKNRVVGSWFYGPDGKGTKLSSGGSTTVTMNHKLYLLSSSGTMKVSSWATVGKKRYYFGADGAAVTGVQTIGGRTYLFNQDGSQITGSSAELDGILYTLSKTDGHVLSSKKIDGSAIVSYGLKFVGGKYVYGGFSLKTGTDCSGFTKLILAHFGITIPRIANDQMQGTSSYLKKLGYTQGKKISDSSLRPGDLVFYGYGNYASHVAIYIGNRKVVHACNSKVGIVVTSIDYVHGRLHNKSIRYWT